MSDRDALHRFIIDDTGVRGEVVRLDASWREVLNRADYPAAVRAVLGEAMAATALLAATIKFDGRIILQASGDGPLHLLVVQANADGGLRALARWKDEVPNAPLAEIFGDARMTITVDTGRDGEQYQGVVELRGDSLGAAIGGYFARSEQLPTRLWLAADDQFAAGLLLQRLPGAACDADVDADADADAGTVRITDADAWDRSCVLADTVADDELLGLGAEELLRRLFHQERLRLFEPEPLHFSCACSHERSAGLIRQLGEIEARDILAEQGDISITCEFCSARYRFDAVDVARLFADGSSDAPHDTLH